ncbi:hypothetical protein [Chlorogloeopsis sp. ULAP02]|uniref:hypothetical protein n=1 Tax=Chlorogloeopsis sp. ULAP02 TaxID=3107926 RepID=UPI0031354A14
MEGATIGGASSTVFEDGRWGMHGVRQVNIFGFGTILAWLLSKRRSRVIQDEHPSSN